MNDCLFCKIIKGDIPCFQVYEDEVVVAFLDINPESNGHTLIIPKKHYKDLLDIDSNTLSHIVEVAKNLMKLLEEKLGCSGFTLIQNNGEVQEINHFHLHIKPYYHKKEELEKPENILKKLSE